MGRRTAIVGMNNPITAHPRYALWPEPVNCTGWRLWKMLEARTGATQTDYVRTFQRFNVMTGNWFIGEAMRRWAVLEPVLAENFDTVVLLGDSVKRAAEIMCGPLLYSPQLVCIPHPSGLNRWYNSRRNTQLVELILEELYHDALS